MITYYNFVVLFGVYYMFLVDMVYSACFSVVGPPPQRRGRGGGQRGRGRFNVRLDGPMKFERDFDFESANAQFNKEEIDREFQNKLKLKGTRELYRSGPHNIWSNTYG